MAVHREFDDAEPYSASMLARARNIAALRLVDEDELFICMRRSADPLRWANELNVSYELVKARLRMLYAMGKLPPLTASPDTL